MTETEIVNVVGTITFRQELDLGALAEALSKCGEIASVTYEPSENHWLQTRLVPDNTYVAFYRSGRCSIAGCESVENFRTTAERVNSIMGDLLEIEYEPETEVSNIVATVDVGESLPLEVLSIELGMESTEYEPEQFPALMYRDPNHVMLVFATGKLLCTGLTDLDSVSEAVESFISRIYTIL